MGWKSGPLRAAISTKGNAASNCASSLRSVTQLLSRRWLASAMRVNLSCQYINCFRYSRRSVSVVITTTTAIIPITAEEYFGRESDVGGEVGILPEMSGPSMREPVFGFRDIGCGAGPILGAIPKRRGLLTSQHLHRVTPKISPQKWAKL